MQIFIDVRVRAGDGKVLANLRRGRASLLSRNGNAKRERNANSSGEKSQRFAVGMCGGSGVEPYLRNYWRLVCVDSELAYSTRRVDK